MVRYVVLVTSVLACLALHASARAATPEDEARALFEQGVREAEREHWVEAEALFRRSLALVERPSTLFNLALALVRRERPCDGLQQMARFEQLSGDSMKAEDERALRRVREHAEALCAELALTIAPPDAELRVDGVPEPSLGQSRRLRLDPGRHVLELRAPDYELLQLEFAIARGERQSREVALRPVPPPLPSVTAVERSATPATTTRARADARPPSDSPREPRDAPPLYRRAWVWTVASVVLVGAAAGGVAAARAGRGKGSDDIVVIVPRSK